MANQPISQMDPLTDDLADDDLLGVVDSSDLTQSVNGSTKRMNADQIIAKKLKTTTGPTVLTVGAVADGEFLKRSGTSIISAAAGGVTINSTDTRIPYRSNSTTFADSFLANDAANGQTTSITGHIMLSQNNGKVIGFGNSTIAFGGFMAGKQASVKVVGDKDGNPGALYADWSSLANPGGNWSPWMSLGMRFYKQLTANIVMSAPGIHGGDGTTVDGYEFEIMFQQDATGGRTITWNSVYKFEAGTPPTPTASANAIDWYRFICRSGNAYCTDFKANFS